MSRSATARSLLTQIAGVAPGVTVRALLAAGRAGSRRGAAEELAVQAIAARAARGRPGPLRSALRPLVERPPQRAAVTADLAALLVALGDPAAAASTCRAGLARTEGEAGRARLHAQLGRALLRTGDATGAVTALRAAVGAGARSRPVWRLWLAQALVATGDLAAAREQLGGGTITELDPGQQARAVRVLFDAGGWDELERAVADAAIDAEAAARAAKLAARADRPTLARSFADAILEPHDRAEALRDLARTHLTRQDLPAAAEVAQAAIDLEPRSLTARTLLLRSFQTAGQLNEARAVVREVTERYPEDAEVLRWAVASAYRLRSWTEAAELVERLRPHDALEARIAAARIAVRTADPDADALYEQLRRERPDDPQVARLGGELHQRSSRHLPAYEAFQRALAQLPDDDTVRLACARLAVQLGRNDEALEHLAVLLERRPRDPRLRRLQVRTEARLGRRRDLDDLAAAGVEPGDDQLVFELVSGLLEGDDTTAAAGALERALHERAHSGAVVEA